jgi:hypothetical protein
MIFEPSVWRSDARKLDEFRAEWSRLNQTVHFQVTRAGAADLVGALPGLKIDRELGVADLAATNRNYRLEALDKLTRGNAKGAVPLLVAALKDPDIEVRGFAVNGLIYFSSAAEPAVPALIEALAE